MKSRIQGEHIAFILFICITFLVVPVAQAAPLPNAESHQGDCLLCHGKEDFTAVLQNGETISLTVTEDHIKKSIHWNENIYCVDCHTKISQDSHPNPDYTPCDVCHINNNYKEKVAFENLFFQLPFQSVREYSLNSINICTDCHPSEAERSADSTHQMVFDQGNLAAPICTDCHTSHQVVKPNEPRSKISEICSACHLAVYTIYEGSVHGAALIGEGNKDVPSCVDCHGVHNISGPYDITFRNASVIMCTTCHSDETLMAPYGISTQIIDTYLKNYHARSSNLFILSNKNRPNDQVVCFDCHGIHNILAPDNPDSQVYPENLLNTCQKCHEDADITFPKTWLGHYVPTIEDNPILFSINILYPILIGTIISGSIVYIFFDAKKRSELKNSISMKEKERK